MLTRSVVDPCDLWAARGRNGADAERSRALDVSGVHHMHLGSTAITARLIN
jgi:hypothetical protein